MPVKHLALAFAITEPIAAIASAVQFRFVENRMIQLLFSSSSRVS
jgi:hypothetical protein